MADSVVSFLLENLTQLLTHESKLLGGVEDQVRSLKNELSLINLFLQKTAGKRQDKLVKEVVSQIRDVAYEAEDVIDTYIITVAEHRRRSKLSKLIPSCDRAITFHEVASKIESIKTINKEINDNRSKYGIEIGESSGGDAEAEEILHRRRKHVEEDQVVGFAHDAEVLMKELMEGSSQRNVVSIIGMGGLGKTTLARKIYNNNDVKNCFDFRGWVYVSQEYRIRELLLEILKGLTPLPRVMLKADLKEELLNNLEALYSSNKDELKGTLIENLKHIKEMNDEEFRKAWSKFLAGIKEQHCDLKISLLGFMQDFYKKNGVKLKDMSDDELKSVLLESLEDKRYLLVMDDIWKTNVWNEVSTAFPNNSNGSRILITSRIKEVALHATTINNSVPPIPPYELPFLNKDKSWELFSKKVFWEGTCPPELETLGRQLVKSCHGLPLAIVVLGGLLASKEKTHRIWSKYIGHVNSYLTEDRSSCIDILALSYNHLPRHLKPCFLYFGIYPEDFEIPVRQLIRLWIAEGFIQQIGNRNIEDVAEDYLEELINRSLIQVATKRLDGGVKTCRIHDLLRDLCISESSEEKFLEIHSNVNLSPIGKSRRISIHYDNNPYIYSSPCKPSKCLPKGIWKLQRLKHLYLDAPTSLPKTDNTAALPNLQVLTGIAINEDTKSHFAKARFPNLRKLGLYSSRWVESGILSSLHPLCHLQTLKIYYLYCFTIPTSIWLTLTKITIVGADISSPTMRVLGSLTKLRILKLRGFADPLITNDFLNCDESSFQQLEVFKMVSLNVFAWNMGQGAMPNLQRLVIENCLLFCMLPNELWCLSALRDVEVLHPGPELVEWLQKLQMRGGCKLHVYPPLNPTN